MISFVSAWLATSSCAQYGRKGPRLARDAHRSVHVVFRGAPMPFVPESHILIRPSPLSGELPDPACMKLVFLCVGAVVKVAFCSAARRQGQHGSRWAWAVCLMPQSGQSTPLR